MVREHGTVHSKPDPKSPPRGLIPDILPELQATLRVWRYRITEEALEARGLAGK